MNNPFSAHPSAAVQPCPAMKGIFAVGGFTGSVKINISSYSPGKSVMSQAKGLPRL